MINLSRISSILGNLGAPQPTFQGSYMQDYDVPEANSLDMGGLNLSQLYQPQHEMSDRLGNLIDNYPQRQKPSKLRQIGAVLAGMGSKDDPMGTADKFQNFHYYNALNDWQKRFTPVEKAADNERQDNTLQRTFANNMLTFKINQQKADELERNNKQKADVQQQNADTSAKRAETARMRAIVYQEMAQGGTIKSDKDGNTYLIDKTGKITALPFDTLSEEEKQQYAMDRIDRTAQHAMDRTIVAQQGAMDRKLTPTAPRTPTPNDEKVMQFNRAQKALLDHPEWAKFVQLGTGNTVNRVASGDPNTDNAISEALTGITKKPMRRKSDGKTVIIVFQDGKPVREEPYAPTN